MMTVLGVAGLLFAGWCFGLVTAAICRAAGETDALRVEFRGRCPFCDHVVLQDGRCPMGCGYKPINPREAVNNG